MNRRALLLAGFATLPAVALPWPANAQPRRPNRRHRASVTPVRRRLPSGRGSLTASDVRTRIVTRAFTSLTPITSPVVGTAGSPYPSTIQVSGFNKGRIVKTRVTLLGFTHTYPSHVDLLLVAPGNVGVVLMSDAGGNDAVTGLTLVLDHDAPSVLPEPLVSGAFQPVNNSPNPDPFPAPAPAGMTGHLLSRFTNRNPNGSWRLFVADESIDDDGGSIAGWTLQLRVQERVRHGQGRGGAKRSRRQQRPTRRAKR